MNRISKFLVSLLLIFSTVLPLAACGGGASESGSPSESRSESASESGSASESEQDPWASVDFNGEELLINVSVHYNTDQTFGPADVYSRGPDSLQGADEVQKLIYDRNIALVEELGLTVTWDETNIIVTQVQAVIESFVRTSPENSPDIFINDVYDALHAMLTGCLWNVYDTADGNGEELASYFDFSHPTWMTEYMLGTSLSHDKRYILASDYFIDVIRYAFVLYVNRDMFDEIMQGQFLTVHDLYQYVLGGEWDYFMLKDYMETAHRDTINKGTTDEEDDQKGLVASNHIERVFTWTSGLSLLEWDGEIYNSTPSVLENNPDMFTFVEEFGALLNTSGMVYVGAEIQRATTLFLDGTYLFAMSMMGEMESEQVRDSGVNKGVLPIPKFDMTIQQDYYTLVHDQAEIACILNNARHFSAATAYLQLASEKSVSIMKEYYDKSLKLKYNEDKDTQEMIDLIHRSVGSPFESNIVRIIVSGNYIPGAPYKGTELFTLIYNSASAQKNSFASDYAAGYDGWCKNLEALISVFDGLR
jgi:hypothetical protein